MQVENAVVFCTRVSSIAVVNASGSRFVEVGWYEDPVDTLAKCDKTFGQPVLLVYAYVDGTIKCKTSTPTLSSGTNSFNVNDNNLDGNWDYYWQGNYEGFFNALSFVSGDPRANGERKSLDDSAFADHTVLKRMNSSAVWTDWTGTTAIENTDPNYNNCIYSNTHTAFKLSC
jgi:hypothetical protein